MFIFGAQLGWFSLGGTTDNPPMALYDLLMSSEFDPEVHFLQQLVEYRGLALDYLLNGRMLRQLPLNVSTPSAPATAAIGSAWLNANETSAMFLLAFPATTPASLLVSFSVNMEQFGFPQSDPSTYFDLVLVTPSGQSKVGTYHATQVTFSTTALARSVVMLVCSHHHRS
jgi:hypothetical protein